MAEPVQPGTTVATGGDDAAKAALAVPAPQAGGSAEPKPDEAAELEALRAQKQQWLGEKSKYEDARRELEDLRTRSSQPTTPPAGYDPMAQQVNDLWLRAQQGDPEAQVQLIAATAQAAHQENERIRAENRWRWELEKVPVGDRDAVDARARNDRISPAAAHNAIEAERYRAEKAGLAEQTRKLQEEQDRLRRGVVSTTAAPAPSAPSSDEITQDEYNRITREAAFGNAEARKRVRLYDEGRLKIRPG